MHKYNEDGTPSIGKREASDKQEQDIAKSLFGRVTPNSGNHPLLKGDIRTRDCLIEAKTTTTRVQCVGIYEKDLKELAKSAEMQGKVYHALAVNFGPGTPNYYVIDERQMKDLLCQDRES